MFGGGRRNEDDEPGDETGSPDERTAQACLKGTSTSADEEGPRDRPGGGAAAGGDRHARAWPGATRGWTRVLWAAGALLLLFPWPLQRYFGARGFAIRGPVVRPAALRRVVSVAPSVTEILFALGAGERVVGCTRWCDYPPQAAHLPRVGGQSLDFEHILSLAPDLVVGVRSYTPAENVETLRRIGLNVVLLDLDTLDDYRRGVETLGDLTGTRAKARQLVDDLDRTVATLQRCNQSRTAAARPRVLVAVQFSPLITVGRGSFIHEMIRLAGGENAFADRREPYPLVDPETLVLRQPQVIVLTHVATAEDFARCPGMQTLDAVRHHRVHIIDGTLMRTGPRLPQGMRLFATWFQTPVGDN